MVLRDQKEVVLHAEGAEACRQLEPAADDPRDARGEAVLRHPKDDCGDVQEAGQSGQPQVGASHIQKNGLEHARTGPQMHKNLLEADTSNPIQSGLGDRHHLAVSEHIWANCSSSQEMIAHPLVGRRMQ